MKKLHSILACVDLSAYSISTMEYAVALARGLMTEIVVLNIINSRDIQAIKSVSAEFPHRVDIDEFLKKTRESRYWQVDEMLNEHFSSDSERMRILVEVGIPFKAILRTIETEMADLVVIGNKGRGNVIGTLFGSNAEKVFRHSPVPVLSIRNIAQFSR
ncbi:universal stress protein [Desulfosediminicola flagellatus]|uniref:universal stress protein n=1 Tax=Desulfosediminicola flagellatus TaxID=2569541 RepID=UPI0010ACF560|nr:universal stress protein [Desulfosediminicola flagellatus]